MGTIADKLIQNLSPYLGPFNAQIAVKTFAQKKLNLTPDQLTAKDLPVLLDALRPMLKTLVGQDSAEAILKRIREGVS